jgi:beta-lactamase superfamily II metal-dependent hydrolase
MASHAYVGVAEATGYAAATGKTEVAHLLWGDRVDLLEAQGARTKVRGRGRTRTFWVETADLQGAPLLEIYFIDVGQGDGILIVTPERKHILIDGGYPRRKQNTGKNAADFVDWKFFRDYGEDRIRLDAMIASHNDEDHYGGLADLLGARDAGGRIPGLDCTAISVERFYHAGLSWWRTATQIRTLGAVAKSGTTSCLVDLLEDRASALAGLDAGADRQLQGEWAKFIERVVVATRADGSPTPLERLSDKSGSLAALNEPDLAFHVLGPVEHPTTKGPGLERLSTTTGQNTNGHSVTLRLDYGKARFLLTGDLNRRAQRALLKAYAGREAAFMADVTKACHHGSDDVSLEFLTRINPSATVISSGDAEGHDHPRPDIVGASGVTGYFTMKDDTIVTPLVYSTELARSLSLGQPVGLSVKAADGTTDEITGARLAKAVLTLSETPPGALNPRTRTRSMGRTQVVAGQVYGLVNVRTDGKTILCATMNESDATWQVKAFPARF